MLTEGNKSKDCTIKTARQSEAALISRQWGSHYAKCNVHGGKGKEGGIKLFVNRLFVPTTTLIAADNLFHPCSIIFLAAK